MQSGCNSCDHLVSNVSEKSPNITKLLLVGSGGVGKTSLASRLVDSTYTESTMTVGLDISTCELEDEIDGSRFKVVTFDLGGQDRFRSFQEEFSVGSKVCLVTIDLARYSSLVEIEEWINFIDHVPKKGRILVANKSDLDAEISDSEIAEISKRYNMPWLKVSSKTGENIDELERWIVQAIKSKNEYSHDKSKILTSSRD
ncbi:MAG: putative Small GTP-binding domain protein [Candidatus Thorarchaeota archaeon]|nr:MAG: putative Small GTP-binding domain protein [Candidatus Thorarchaeota archaeon]